MYCPKCNCEYTGWSEKCPVCRTVLLGIKPDVASVEPNTVDYTTLVDAVRQNGGSLTIDVAATDIESKQGRGFPYIGRGYAWVKIFRGSYDLFTVHLTTTEVGRDRSYHFPYFGYGFAWEKEMQGEVSGNPITLISEKVHRETQMGFPYRGYGRAWVQTMSGDCGKSLNATLTITEVQQRKKWGFPYFGFGFAWPNAGELRLTLVP